MCGNTWQPRYSLVPSASLNLTAGVAADTLILESASFASWPCDRYVRVPWARDQMGTGAFPNSRTDADSVLCRALFFSFFSRRRTVDTDKGRKDPRGDSENGRWRSKSYVSFATRRFRHVGWVYSHEKEIMFELSLEHTIPSSKNHTYNENKTSVSVLRNDPGTVSRECEPYDSMMRNENCILLCVFLYFRFSKISTVIIVIYLCIMYWLCSFNKKF